MKIIFKVVMTVLMVMVASTIFAQVEQKEQVIQPLELKYPVEVTGRIQTIEPICMIELLRIPTPKLDVNYQGELNTSYGVSIGNDFQGIINIETIHGVRVGSHISVGVGVGINIFNDRHSHAAVRKMAKLVMMPIFADVKWYPLDQKISPYFALDMGVAVSVNQNHLANYQGPYFAFGGGVSFKMGYKGAFNVGLAIKSNNVYSKYGAEKSSISAIDIKAAIVF